MNEHKIVVDVSNVGKTIETPDGKKVNLAAEVTQADLNERDLEQQKVDHDLWLASKERLADFATLPDLEAKVKILWDAVISGDLIHIKEAQSLIERIESKYAEVNNG